MPTREHYLQQALSAFEVAALSQDDAVRARWIKRATEFQILAEAMGPDASVPQTNGQAQQQPMQQQQDKTGILKASAQRVRLFLNSLRF